MNNLRKFSTEADYSAATLNYPAVSWVTATDNVYFNKTAPTPTMNGDIKATYSVKYASQPMILINQEGTGSGSGSGSGGAAFTPTQMWVDGVEVTPSASYTFSTTGNHIVEFELGDGVNSIPQNAFGYAGSGIESLISVEIGNDITSIGDSAFRNCGFLTSCTISSGVTYIGESAFNCRDLASITCYALTPPTLGMDVFSDSQIGWGSGIIYVPSASVSTYQNNSYWTDYSSQIQAIQE